MRKDEAAVLDANAKLNAAERVRVARTMAAMRQDEESAAELAAALTFFKKFEGKP